jgi:hypothetical protein
MGIFKQSIEFNVCNGIFIVPLTVKAASFLKAQSPTDMGGLKLPPIKSPEGNSRGSCNNTEFQNVILL